MTTKKLLRVESAKKRKLIYDKLTTKQKIEKLDQLFGEGKGAKKEREKLSLKLVSDLNVKPELKAKINEKRNYQKPKRS